MMIFFWLFIGRAKGMFLSFHHFVETLLRLLKGILVMLWNQIVFLSTASIWEVLINATNCYQIMQFQRSQSSGGKKVFFWLLELRVINSMCLFFEKSPEFRRKRNNHKRYQEMLIHKLVLPLLHKENNNEPPTNMGCPSQANKRSRINVQYDIHLRGRHYVTKKHPRRKCTICGYKKNQQTHTKLLWKMSKTYLWRQFPSLPYSKLIIKMFFTIYLKAYYIPSDIDHIISFQKYWGLACDLFCFFCSAFFQNWSLACGLFFFYSFFFRIWGLACDLLLFSVVFFSKIGKETCLQILQ